MANDLYTVNAQGRVAAGKFLVPAWVRNQALNTWGTVPLVQTWNDLDPALDAAVNPNFPSNAPWRGIIGFKGRAIAWNGHTAHNGVIYDPPAGGHGDYAGNERFKCDLNAENPTVVRLTNPSGAIGNLITLDDGQESTGLYADGQPRSPHNYNSPVFHPQLNKFILAVLGNGLYKSGQAGIAACAIFNADSGAFEGLSSVSTGGTGTHSPMSSCYDSNRNEIWYRGAGTARFASIDIGSNTWTNRGSQTALSGSIATAYIPEHDVILIINTQYTNKFAIFDCTTYQYFQPAVTGALQGMSLAGTCQPTYLGGGRFALWDNSSNTTVINTMEFVGDPRSATWQFGQLTVSGANAVTPTVRQTNGTYGRFQWHEKLGIFTLLNAMDQQLYFFKAA